MIICYRLPKKLFNNTAVHFMPVDLTDYQLTIVINPCRDSAPRVLIITLPTVFLMVKFQPGF